MAQIILKQKLLALSEASEWESARREWRLEDIEDSDHPDTCACGHNPIFELCYIRNKINHNRLLVGNHCVKHFLGIRTDKIFSAIKRIRFNSKGCLNQMTVEFARQCGWINWEQCNLYYATMGPTNTRTKRNLCVRDLDNREQINQIILNRVRRHSRAA